jgi:hypothetical protein
LVIPAAFSAYADEVNANVLSSPNGKFVLGSVETGSGATSDKRLYMIDTTNGQVWYQGCIVWDQDNKCIRFGLRPLGVSDGQGGKIFDNAEAWSYANDLGKMLRESDRPGQKNIPSKK